MKKSILILGTILITISLTAISLTNWVKIQKPSECSGDHSSGSSENTSEVIIAVREIPDIPFDLTVDGFARISKEELNNVQSVNEIIPKPADWSSYPIQQLRVSIEVGGLEIYEIGENLKLNKEQKALLSSVNYNDEFKLNAKCVGKHKDVDREEFELNYTMSVVPEKEAVYSEGNEALYSFLKEKSLNETAEINIHNLGFGSIAFTVSKDGSLKNILLGSVSTYPELDEKFLELLMELPGSWEVATDGNGEPVEQDLIITYGKMGC